MIDPNKKTHKIKNTAREEVIAEIAKMDRRGHTQMEIRAALINMFKVTISQAQISIHLKTIRLRYLESQQSNRAEMIAEKVQQYREVRREAWAAWERSKKNSQKKVSEKAPPKPKEGEDPVAEKKVQKGLNAKLRGKIGGKADAGETAESLRLLKEIVTSEGRLPASEYLSTVIRTLEAECKLLGLEPEVLPAPQYNIFTSLQELLTPSVIEDPMQPILEAKGLITPALETQPSTNGAH